MMRDAKICEIGEGTNEIQRLVIGRYILEDVLADPFEQVHSPGTEETVVGAHSS
jgi:hypothetical protein